MDGTALAAFLALIALAIGGFLLFRALSDDDEAGNLTLKNYVNQPLEEVTADLDELDLPYQPVPEESDEVAEGFVHRTDPEAGDVVQRDELITLYFNPMSESRPDPRRHRCAARAGQIPVAGCRVPSRQPGHRGGVDRDRARERDSHRSARRTPRRGRARGCRSGVRRTQPVRRADRGCRRVQRGRPHAGCSRTSPTASTVSVRTEPSDGDGGGARRSHRARKRAPSCPSVATSCW